MSTGSKGSSPRPFSVDSKTFAANWDNIFVGKNKVEDNTGIQKNEYYDVISTEDCFDKDSDVEVDKDLT